MEQSEIIRIAREAGFQTNIFRSELERFAALVAAHEREARAKVCDDMGKTMADRDGEITEWCAAAIRERGEK